ncbi:Tn3 family transposase, partial [Klebsiella pneumoniae]|uniref:Tn3 family transposase n=1 Tax=Klebsiella pneumoniae TaxID=573 RepID=UPI0028F42442
YSHVSDQYAPFATQVIPATASEAPYILDGLLMNDAGRHIREQHQLARQLFKTINRWLAEAGVMMTQGTLVDATIIEAPSSTK